jgi:2-dehydropantoate 2-reductase
MRVVIVGAGGVGGYLGVRLSEAGYDVRYLVRGRNLATLREKGITLINPLGNVSLGPQEASDTAAEFTPADVVIVTVKLYSLAAVAPKLVPLLGPETAVLPVQNGVEAHTILTAVLGSTAPLKGTMSIKSFLESPGKVICKSPFCRIRFAEGNGQIIKRTERIAAMLNACIGVDAVLSTDIDGDLWRKFIMLASFSAVACMARATIGQVLNSAEARELLLEATAEAAAVGRAHGVYFPADLSDIVDKQVRDMPMDGRASMLEDLEAGRRLELPFLSGAVVRLGKQKEIPTPVHSVAYRSLVMHVGGRSDWAPKKNN